MLGMSANRIAKLLVVFPIAFVLLVMVLSIIIRSSALSEYATFEGIVQIFAFEGLLLLFWSIVFLWVSWVWGTVKSVKEEVLGIKLKWFKYGFYIFITVIVWQCIWTLITSDALQLFEENSAYPVLNEVTGMITALGLFIGYPIVCHYAARALYTKKTKETATFMKALGYSLLMIFMPISIPFLHRQINEGSDKNSDLIISYGIAFFLVFVLFGISLYAALSGAI